MNWNDFLHPASDAIIFGYTDNPAHHLWSLNAGVPL